MTAKRDSESPDRHGETRSSASLDPVSAWSISVILITCVAALILWSIGTITPSQWLRLSEAGLAAGVAIWIGGALVKWRRRYLPSGVPVSHRLVQRSETSAVYATTVRFAGRARDWYNYLVFEDERWKIRAIRTLALPAFLEAAFASVSSDPEATEYHGISLDRLRLGFASDSALADHYAANSQSFRDLASGCSGAPDCELSTTVARPSSSM